jgi:alkylhydroperoxidase/carboxymuconolactone decarboxylase family protein YurZ
MKNYTEIAERYQIGFADLAEMIPTTASSFGGPEKDATSDGALPTKTKELIAFAIAISV